MQAYLAKLLRYTTWANQRLLTALRELPAAQAEGLPLLAHLLAAEHHWLCRLRGVEARLPVWPTLTLEEAAALLEENSAGYRDFLQSLPAEELSRLVRYRNTKGLEFQTAISDILTHVVIHSGYHRGQVAKAIGRAGGSAVNTDYIQFTRETL